MSGRLSLGEEQISEIFMLYKKQLQNKQERKDQDPLETLIAVKATYEKKLIKKKFIYYVEQRKKAQKELANRVAELGIYELGEILKLLEYTELDIITQIRKRLNRASNLGFKKLNKAILSYNKQLWLFQKIAEKTKYAISFNQTESQVTKGLELKRRVLRKFYKTLTTYENIEGADLVPLQKTIVTGIDKLTNNIKEKEKNIEKKMLKYQALQYDYQRLRAKKFKIFKNGETLQDKLSLMLTNGWYSVDYAQRQIIKEIPNNFNNNKISQKKEKHILNNLKQNEVIHKNLSDNMNIKTNKNALDFIINLNKKSNLSLKNVTKQMVNILLKKNEKPVVSNMAAVSQLKDKRLGSIKNISKLNAEVKQDKLLLNLIPASELHDNIFDY